MKTRIISALVAAAILFAVLLCPYTLVLAPVVAAVAAIAVWELLYATHHVKQRWIVAVCMVFAALEVMAVYMTQIIVSSHSMYVLQSIFDSIILVPSNLLLTLKIICWSPIVLVSLFTVFALLLGIITRSKGGVRPTVYAYGMTLYATLGFSAIAALRYLHPTGGIAYILLTMVIPWMSDMGAYFIGTFFGKHKMAPIISPKKSWEGFFGGWAVSVAAAAPYALICNIWLTKPVDPITFVIAAAVLAPLSVCGDLFASMIKRRSGIKDYGNIMPGHGGVMDRFDSVVFIAPLLYLLLMFL